MLELEPKVQALPRCQEADRQLSEADDRPRSETAVAPKAAQAVRLATLSAMHGVEFEGATIVGFHAELSRFFHREVSHL